MNFHKIETRFRMKVLLLVFVVIAPSASNSNPQLDYSNQQLWGGECQTGKKQSPVNITRSDANITLVKTKMMNLPWTASNVVMKNLFHKNTIMFEPELDLMVEVPGK